MFRSAKAQSPKPNAHFVRAACFALVPVAVMAVCLILARPSATAERTPVANALMTEPDDGRAAILSAIAGAKSSVDLVIYELTDADVESALVDASRRGVSVRVLLCGAGPTRVNQAAFDYFRANGVPTRWTSPGFALTHQKTLVADRVEAFLMTFNLVPKYYPTGRDFALVDHDSADIAAIESVFDADWDRRPIAAPGGDDLVWSPGSRSALVALIDSAQKTLDVYEEEMKDKASVKALAAAAVRGVDVRIVATDASADHAAYRLLISAGARVHTFAADAPLYVHAKAVIADGTRVFLGSENFSFPSLEMNRELGAIVSDPSIEAGLAGTFARDWRAATPFPPIPSRLRRE